jgi:hypothetical protein
MIVNDIVLLFPILSLSSGPARCHWCYAFKWPESRRRHGRLSFLTSSALQYGVPLVGMKQTEIRRRHRTGRDTVLTAPAKYEKTRTQRGLKQEKPASIASFRYSPRRYLTLADSLVTLLLGHFQAVCIRMSRPLKLQQLWCLLQWPHAER